MKFEQWAKGRAVGAKGTHGYMMVEAAWNAAVQECIRAHNERKVDSESTQTSCTQRETLSDTALEVAQNIR